MQPPVPASSVAPSLPDDEDDSTYRDNATGEAMKKYEQAYSTCARSEPHFLGSVHLRGAATPHPNYLLLFITLESDGVAVSSVSCICAPVLPFEPAAS